MTVITIAENIKDEIARRIVEQAQPGYASEYMGEWYVVDGVQLMHAQQNRHFDPWHDGAEVVSVEDLVFIAGGAHDDHADFDAGNYYDDDEVDAAISFALSYIPDAYEPAEIAAYYGE